MFAGIIIASVFVLAAGVGVAMSARKTVDDATHSSCAVSLGRTTALPIGVAASLALVRAAAGGARVAGAFGGLLDELGLRLPGTPSTLGDISQINSPLFWGSDAMKRGLRQALVSSLGYSDSTATTLAAAPGLICLPPDAGDADVANVLYRLPLAQRRSQLNRAKASARAILDAWWASPGQTRPADAADRIAGVETAIANVISSPGSVGAV
jgi:hypothetical protein